MGKVSSPSTKQDKQATPKTPRSVRSIKGPQKNSPGVTPTKTCSPRAKPLIESIASSSTNQDDILISPSNSKRSPEILLADTETENECAAEQTKTPKPDPIVNGCHSEQSLILSIKEENLKKETDQSAQELIPSIKEESLKARMGTTPGQSPISKKNKNKKMRKKLKNKLLYSKVMKSVMPVPIMEFIQEIIPESAFSKDRKKTTVVNIVVKKSGKIKMSGDGPTNADAKYNAAENALKETIRNVMYKVKATTPDRNEKIITDKLREALPWEKLGRLAILKMLKQWKEDGLDLKLVDWDAEETPPAYIPRKLTVRKKTRQNVPDKEKSTVKSTVDKTTRKKPSPIEEFDDYNVKLPPQASKMHPISVLNIMFPGIRSVEVERSKSIKTTMAYKIGGVSYEGTARNGKKARRLAAAKYCLQRHGIKCPMPLRSRKSVSGPPAKRQKTSDVSQS